MKVNGTLQYKIKTGGGFLNGDPIPVCLNWSRPIECQIQANRHETTGKYVDGKFTIASYTILAELQQLDYAQIKLTTIRGKNLGEFEVQHVEYFDTVCRTKITV